MNPRLTKLLGQLQSRLALISIQYRKFLPGLLALLAMTGTRLVQLAGRLYAWLAANWPPMRERLRLAIKSTHNFLKRASRQTLRQLVLVLRRLGSESVLVAGKLARLVHQLAQWTQSGISRHWPPVRQRLFLYVDLARLNRPTGILLLLWPTLWAVWIAAEGQPSLHLILVFTLGVVLTRSAGCVLNDMADRKFDAHVSRTATRPLATGKVAPREALVVACILLLLAFLLVLTTNRYTVILSFVAIPLAVIYPFMKRYTYVPQFFLGLAFSWGIPMAFSAHMDSVPQIAWLLFIANILWSVVYDTIYAMVDREDDRKVGIKSTAILFDDADRTIIGILQLMFLTAMFLVGIQIGAKMFYYASLIPAVALMIYHQYLIRHRDPDGCFRAFLNNQWVGLTLFAGLYLNYL